MENQPAVKGSDGHNDGEVEEDGGAFDRAELPGCRQEGSLASLLKAGHPDGGVGRAERSTTQRLLRFQASLLV